jgi:hypothetical protein
VTETLPSRDPRGLHAPPWEERDRYGIINALVLTIRQVLTEPGRFFHRMPVGLGLTQPVLFALVLAVVAAMFEWMWGLAIGGVPALLAPDAMPWLRNPWLGTGQFVLSPLIALVMVFLRAGVFHLMLTLLGADRLGFEATLRVVAYGRATRLLAILPFCGGFIGLVWELVVDVIGLARIHGCEEWKALVAVIVPALVVIVLVGAWLLAAVGLALLA